MAEDNKINEVLSGLDGDAEHHFEEVAQQTSLREHRTKETKDQIYLQKPKKSASFVTDRVATDEERDDNDPKGSSWQLEVIYFIMSGN